MQIIKFHLVDIGVVEGCVYFIQNKEWCRLVARHSIWKMRENYYGTHRTISC